jgi:hypothetical protein
MRVLEIPVDLDRMAKPRNRFFVPAEKDFGAALEGFPEIDRGVARAQSEGILDMGFCLFAVADIVLR